MSWSAISYQVPFGILVIDQELCSGCGECIPVCPYSVLVLAESGRDAWVDARHAEAVESGRDARVGARHAEAAEPGSCTCCTACQTICPEGAISVELISDSS